MLLGNDPVRILRKDPEEEGGGGGARSGRGATRARDQARAQKARETQQQNEQRLEALRRDELSRVEKRPSRRNPGETYIATIDRNLAERRARQRFEAGEFVGVETTDPPAAPPLETGAANTATVEKSQEEGGGDGAGDTFVPGGSTQSESGWDQEGGLSEGSAPRYPTFGGGRRGGRARLPDREASTIRYEENTLKARAAMADNLRQAGAELEYQGALQAARGEEMAAEYGNQVEYLGKLADEYENARKNAYETSMAEIRKLQKLGEEITNMAPQPGRLFLNAHGAATFGAALSIAAGAMNSSRFGGKNMALGIIEGAIQRDLDAQMAAQVNARAGAQLQRGIFQDMQEVYKSDRVARHAYMNFQYTLAAKELKKIAATWDSLIMKSKADQMAAEMNYKANNELMMAGRVLVDQQVSYAAGNAQQALTRALGGLTIQNTDDIMKAYAQDGADQRLEAMTKNIRQLQQQEMLSKEQADRLVEIARQKMQTGRDIERGADEVDPRGALPKPSIVGRGQQAGVGAAPAPGAPAAPAPGTGAAPGDPATTTTAKPPVKPTRDRARLRKETPPKEAPAPEQAQPSTPLEKAQDRLRQLKEKRRTGTEQIAAGPFGTPAPRLSPARIKELDKEIAEAQQEVEAAERGQEQRRVAVGRAQARLADIDPPRDSAAVLTAMKTLTSGGQGGYDELSPRSRQSMVSAFTGMSRSELTPKVVREKWPQVIKAMKDLYPDRVKDVSIGGVSQSLKTDSTAQKFNQALRVVETWARNNGGPLSQEIQAAILGGGRVIDTLTNKTGAKGFRFNIPVAVTNPAFDPKTGKPRRPKGDLSRGVAMGWSKVAVPDPKSGKSRLILVPSLYNPYGMKRGKFANTLKEAAGKGARYVGDITNTQRSAENRGALRKRVFANDAARQKFLGDSAAARQVDDVLQILQFAGQYAKRTSVADRAGWNVEGGVITISPEQLKKMPAKDRKFWQRYEAKLKSLDAGLSGKDRKGSGFDAMKTKSQAALDRARQSGGIVIAPGVLRSLAVGLLSQATGRGVPQAFEAKELRDNLGKSPDDVFQWLKHMSGQTQTSRVVLNRWLNGEELRNVTFDLNDIQEQTRGMP